MGNNYYTKYQNTAPKTAFTVAAMDVPFGELDKAITKLKNIAIGGGGTITYVKATGVLTWSATINIYFTSSAGLTVLNTIAAGNVTLADAQFAYVDLSETTGTALTVTAASFPAGGAASTMMAFNRIILAHRNTASDNLCPVYLHPTYNDPDKLVKSSNLSDVANAATAFANIKQSATTLATGVAELATVAEAVAGISTTLTPTCDGVAAAVAVLAREPDQGVAMTYAASGTGIQVADNDNIDFGTNSFTFVWKGSLPDWTPVYTYVNLCGHGTSNTDGYTFRVDGAGTLSCRLVEAIYVSSAVTGFVDGTSHELTYVVAVGATNTTVDFYIDGKALGVQQTATNPGNVSAAAVFALMSSWANISRFAGTTHHAYTFNRALTAAEVLDLYRNGIAYADKWGSQTNLITDTNDQDFSSGTIGNWVVDNTGCNGTCVYDAGPAAEKTGKVTIGSTVGTYTGAKLTFGTRTTALQAYKTYIFECDVWLSVGHSLTSLQITSAGSLSDETLKSTSIASIATTGAWQHISHTLITGADTTGFLYVLGAGGATGDYFYFDNVSIKKIGATLALEPANIQPAPGQWLDSSSNNLHALQPATGSSLTRSKRDFTIKWTNTWAGTHELQYIGGVNQAILPPNCYIDSIIGVITGGTIEDIIIGDGSDTDRWVTITTGLAAGTVAFTIANAISDGTNYKMTVDPDANFTGSIAWTINGKIL
jgi:hypothetical protein